MTVICAEEKYWAAVPPFAEVPVFGAEELSCLSLMRSEAVQS